MFGGSIYYKGRGGAVAPRKGRGGTVAPREAVVAPWQQQGSAQATLGIVIRRQQSSQHATPVFFWAPVLCVLVVESDLETGHTYVTNVVILAINETLARGICILNILTVD